MKKIIALLLAAVMCLSLVACGSKNDNAAPSESTSSVNDVEENKEPTGLTKEECIGAWEWDYKISKSNDWGIENLELNDGGVGKGTNSLHKDGAYYPLSWEIEDDILKISMTADPLSDAFYVDGDTMTSTDGDLIYKRTE